MAPARQRPWRIFSAKVQELLTVLVQDFHKRGLRRALDDVEKIFLMLDPRFKSLCTVICLNGENDLQNEVRALVEYKIRVLAAMLLSARGASAPVAAEIAKVREVPKQERQAPKSREGVGEHRGGRRGPACYVQDGQD